MQAYYPHGQLSQMTQNRKKYLQTDAHDGKTTILAGVLFMWAGTGACPYDLFFYLSKNI